jgi:hypothetical protein
MGHAVTRQKIRAVAALGKARATRFIYAASMVDEEGFIGPELVAKIHIVIKPRRWLC